VGPCKTLLMDEISTGLDSSTTHQIVRCIRNVVHLRKARVPSPRLPQHALPEALLFVPPSTPVFIHCPFHAS
jgi:hypothetical protein